MDLGQVKLTVTSCLLSEGNVDHAMVHQLCQGREVGDFLANQPTCAIKEGFHLDRHHAKLGWHSKHEAIILRKLIQEAPV